MKPYQPCRNPRTCADQRRACFKPHSVFYRCCRLCSCHLAEILSVFLSAYIFDHSPATFVALDKAAPLKLATAALDDASTNDLIAPATAHQVAAVWRTRSPVTFPTTSTETSGSHVRLAEVWRFIEVDKIGIGWCLELLINRHQFSSSAADQFLHHLQI
jgi:hypothetical protein